MGDSATLIRLVAASTLIGLLAFCIAHVVQVWRKRNARSSEGRPRGQRLAWACLLAGAVLLPVATVHRELTRAEGVISGEGLFVVRASEDLAVEWLRDDDAVAAGEPLARFGSGTRSARSEELLARLARAEAELNVMALLPLLPDPELTRRQQSVTQERSQAQLELGQALIAAEAAGRDMTAQIFAKKEAIGRLEVTLTERRKELDRTKLRSSHANQQLALLRKITGGGAVSATEYQDQLKASRDAEIQMAALSQELKDLLAEQNEFRSQFDKLEAERSDPASALRKQVAALTARLARLEIEEAELKPKSEMDLARSSKLRDAEKAQVEAKVREHRAAVNATAQELEVRAPFAGRIAYRTASPNASRARSTLAVLAPADGFRLTSRMGQSEADAMRGAGEVVIEVGEDSPERRIPARFRRAVSLAHEPGYAALQLECQPPPEMVRRLAEGEKLTVAFAWHPPLFAMWPFRIGVLLLAAGMVGLIVPCVRGIGRRIREGKRLIRDVMEGIRSIEVRRPLEVRTSEEMEDLPGTFEEVEAHYRESVAQLNRATNAQEAAGLLTRLRKLRWHQRSMKKSAPNDKFQQLRQVLIPVEPAPSVAALKQYTPRRI